MENLKKRVAELMEESKNKEQKFIQEINECTDNEHLRKLVLYYNDQVKEIFKEQSRLEQKILQHQEYKFHLSGMLEWIKENFGDVDTSDFGNKNLAEYIDECLEMEKELLEKINN